MRILHVQCSDVFLSVFLGSPCHWQLSYLSRNLGLNAPVPDFKVPFFSYKGSNFDIRFASKLHIVFSAALPPTVKSALEKRKCRFSWERPGVSQGWGWCAGCAGWTSLKSWDSLGVGGTAMFAEQPGSREAGAPERKGGRHFQSHCLHEVFEWPLQGFYRKFLILECQLVN